VSAALAGERGAFDKLVERYQRRAVAVALRLLGNRDDAFEAAQEGFLRAYQALGQLAEPGRFAPWLMRIMANTALNFRRRRSREVRISLDQSVAEEAGEGVSSPVERVAGREPTAQQELAGKELAAALQQAIEKLPENLRAPLVLFAIEKLPQKEIAAALDCSVETVKWSVFEARRRLRGQLRDYF